MQNVHTSVLGIPLHPEIEKQRSNYLLHREVSCFNWVLAPSTTQSRLRLPLLSSPEPAGKMEVSSVPRLDWGLGIGKRVTYHEIFRLIQKRRLPPNLTAMRPTVAQRRIMKYVYGTTCDQLRPIYQGISLHNSQLVCLGVRCHPVSFWVKNSIWFSVPSHLRVGE